MNNLIHSNNTQHLTFKELNVDLQQKAFLMYGTSVRCDDYVYEILLNRSDIVSRRKVYKNLSPQFNN